MPNPEGLVVEQNRRNHIVAQDALNGHTIIPWSTFEKEVLGDIPVALNAIMLATRYVEGDFVKDIEWSIADTGALKFADFPMVVTISVSVSRTPSVDLA